MLLPITVLRHLILMPDMCLPKNCYYMRQTSSSKIKWYQHADKPGLPIIIRNKMLPTFMELWDETLLEKCLHGSTQNNNERINGVIWKRTPTDILVGRIVLEIGVCSAVLSFNVGAIRLSKIFEKLSMVAGSFIEEFCASRDEYRIQKTDIINQVKRQRRNIF